MPVQVDYLKFTTLLHSKPHFVHTVLVVFVKLKSKRIEMYFIVSAYWIRENYNILYVFLPSSLKSN